MPATKENTNETTPDILCDEIDLTPEDEAALEAAERKRCAANEANEDDAEEGTISEDRMHRFTWRDEDIKWL